MRIVNLIHIGDQVLSLDDMDPMKKAEIALRLNEQSLKTLGYAAKKKEESAQPQVFRALYVVYSRHHTPLLHN